jgi:20S proteasome subunit beta 6
MMDGGYEIYTRQHLTSRLWSTGGDDSICEPDGSLSMEERLVSVRTAPVWIASSGCAADCEALKRTVRFEVRASQHWNTALGVTSISSLLSQVLYNRRNFPYYSFCVVAGLNDGEGAAYVYDAIGSFEQVAVATAGTGRELLQPILDRLFASPHEEEEDSMKKSGIAVMPHVVKTRVSCSADEAVARLIRGYKSVAERDIGVGDSVVLCVAQRNQNGGTTCRVVSVPLKTH